MMRDFFRAFAITSASVMVDAGSVLVPRPVPPDAPTHGASDDPEQPSTELSAKKTRPLVRIRRAGSSKERLNTGAWSVCLIVPSLLLVAHRRRTFGAARCGANAEHPCSGAAQAR